MTQLAISAPQHDIYDYERELSRFVADEVVRSESIEASDLSEVVVRSILPSVDLDTGSENGWSSDEEWRQDWSSNGSGTAFNQAYQVDSAARAEDKIILFHKVIINSTTIEARAIRWTASTSGVGGVKAEANLEPIESEEESAGVLADPVIYDANENGTIDFWIENANDGQRVLLDGFVGEAVGEVISTPTNYKFNSDGQPKLRYSSLASDAPADG